MIAAVVGFSGIAECAQAQSCDPITSSFLLNSEGWYAVDLSVATFSEATIYGPASWMAAGGVPSGCIWTTDPSSQWITFRAPQAYVVSLANAGGGTLSVDINPGLADAAPIPVFIIASSIGKLFYSTTLTPSTWHHVSVPLVASAWRVGNYLDGPAPTDEQFATAIATASGLYVNADWHSGNDLTKVDNVVLHPSLPEDFNGDCSVSGADLGLLLGGWGTPAGDLNGDGTTDGADLGILLNSWTG